MDELYYETNYPFIKEPARNNPQNHKYQIEEVTKTVKGFKDFLDSAKNIQPMYQGIAFLECTKVFADYQKKYNAREGQ